MFGQILGGGEDGRWKHSVVICLEFSVLVILCPWAVTFASVSQFSYLSFSGTPEFLSFLTLERNASGS